MSSKENKRLESLDMLRGADLFALVVIEVLIHPLNTAINAPWTDSVMWYFTHMDWDGFSSWDIVMPLFMFMTGIFIPYALTKYKDRKIAAIKKIMVRGILLWIFGMMCQGNLLALDGSRIYLFSNTLQAISIGYVVSALLFILCGRKMQIGACAFLFLLYWVGMEFFTIGEFGQGSYTPDSNFAEGIDRTVLGRFRDCAYVDNGNVVFAGYYTYTWVWSSLNFVVTVMSGVFAGYILRSKSLENGKKAICLLCIGAGLCITGWCMHPVIPVIKRIWTNSMVLVSSGYCFMLMAAFFYIFDCRHIGNKSFGWLKVYGQNSLAAYMLAMCVSFSSIGQSLLFGLQQYIGAFYPVLITLCNVAINYFILYLMFRNRIFLKV